MNTLHETFINGRPVPTFVNAWKNVEFHPEATLFPRSLEEVVDIVNLARKWGRKLKPVGGAHSFSHNFKTEGMLVDIRHLNRILKVEGDVVHMEAGITIADIIAALDPLGLHFPTLGSWSSQSISGAIATATHGSTLHTQCLSDIVEELEVVLSDGSVRTFGGNEVEAKALRASIGQLGIVTKVKAKFTPAFFLQCNIHSLPEEEGFRTILSVAKQHEFVNMLWLPYIGETCIRILKRSDETQANEKAKQQAQAAFRMMRFDKTIKDLRDFFDGHEFLENPRDLAVPYSLKYKDAFFSDDGVVDKSYNVFRYDKYGEPNTNHWLRLILNSEHALAVEHLEPALFKLKNVVREYADRGRFINWPRLHIRFTAGSDKTLIAMNSGRDTAYVGIYIIGTIQHQPQIDLCRAIEQVLIEAGGRPHWGKFRYSKSDAYKKTYPHYQTFLGIRNKLDPVGMYSEGMEPHDGLDYLEEPPTLQMIQSLFDRHTYFPVRLL